MYNSAILFPFFKKKYQLLLFYCCTYFLCQITEHLEIAKSKMTGELIAWADIQKMKYSWNAVCETLRLTAPGQGGGFREVINDFKFESFNIPKGWKVRYIICQTGAHLGSLIYNFLCCARH